MYDRLFIRSEPFACETFTKLKSDLKSDRLAEYPPFDSSLTYSEFSSVRLMTLKDKNSEPNSMEFQFQFVFIPVTPRSRVYHVTENDIIY